MKRYELDIIHRYKEKFISLYRITAEQDVVVLGQALGADVRLLGDDVAGVHAFLENSKSGWVLVDGGSTAGTWINKQPVQIETIETEKNVTIAGHHLVIRPRLVESGLFDSEKVEAAMKSGGKRFHQVILRQYGSIIQTELLGESEPYVFTFGGETRTMAAPKEGQWIEDLFGEILVQRRIARADDVKITLADYFKNLGKTDVKWPVTVAIVVLILISGVLLLVGRAPDDQIAEVSKQNQFTRMIFDAKVLKKKREEAIERRTVMKKAAGTINGGGPGREMGTTPVAGKSTHSKVISKVQSISALLGKISKRANSKTVQIVFAGKTADQPGAGRALAAVGSLQGVTSAVGSGGTYKVAGIGTIGKGGGAVGAIGALGSLATGGAGTASVGVLDEETEIEGGLDRDVIARVIQSQLGEIRYCYERQLSADPDLYGKVQVKFTIDGSGGVIDQRVGATTLNSAMVEGCILRRMTRWKFPKPKGGTHVLVTYPFMFKATQ